MTTATLPRLYRASEVAAILGISPDRVRELVAEGKLPSVRFGSAGWHRIPAEAVDASSRARTRRETSNGPEGPLEPARPDRTDLPGRPRAAGTANARLRARPRARSAPGSERGRLRRLRVKGSDARWAVPPCATDGDSKEGTTLPTQGARHSLASSLSLLERSISIPS
jgi:excisionase family DNA binding protein